VKRTLAVLLGTIVAFFLHGLLHLEPAVVALTGATVMLLVAADDVESALERVEWSTLFFFLGLFVMVGGLEERGVVDQVAEWLADVSGGSPRAEGLIVLWGAAAGSAAVDNIPFTAAMIPVVDSLQGGEFEDGLWWALALGACFGGNATMIAAAANVAATGILDRSGQPISFVRFLLVGLPVTFVSLLIATVYLLLFQL
jgi:Na+/H+ antiporter NhaD/arsenite permease-like protein